MQEKFCTLFYVFMSSYYPLYVFNYFSSTLYSAIAEYNVDEYFFKFSSPPLLPTHNTDQRPPYNIRRYSVLYCMVVNYKKTKNRRVLASTRPNGVSGVG